MPDPNKFEKLRQIGYFIPVCCSFCGHSTFQRNSDWGSCGLHLYIHTKHQTPHGVSIHRTGTCRDAIPRVTLPSELGAHIQFMTAAEATEPDEICSHQPPGDRSD